ncbi:MAG: hypothetical protein KIH65_002680 [Candidatus Uhrbacteria bacterium]|nr:hypothetical protein [Candidatus Uhrbacteria bacterium]
MFDEAPKNLPFEPTPSSDASKPISPPTPLPASESPKRPFMKAQGGILVGQKKEPEDILSDVEPLPSSQEAEAIESFDDAPKGGKGFRMVVIILSVLAAVLVLAVGGVFLFRRFMPSSAPAVEPPVSDTTIPTAPVDSIPPSVPTNTTIPSSEPEAPPAVPETPPATIPQPQPVGQVDTDNDGLSDAAEAELKTDPRSPDTDGDGLVDGKEQSFKGDPLVADTDGDGLTDGDEVQLWTTDPSMMDTDGDGYPDGSEVKNGYNPNGDGRLPAMR